MNNDHKSIAISKNGKDCIRIKPFGSTEDKAEIKFSFLDKSFIIRRFEANKDNTENLFNYSDFGLATHEITYHNSNEKNLKPSILPKYKNNNERVPISQEIMNLELKNLIVPIPICRVTVNQESDIIYKQKKYHNNINLDSKYNTTEFYISSSKYDTKTMSERFPLILNYLFHMATMDYIIYGAGVGCIPLLTKMFENKEPVVALESDLIDKYRIFYRTYELTKDNAYFIYSKPEYYKTNFIEFFNNIDYLGLLATTKISFKTKEADKFTPPKPAYKYDIEHLKRIGFYKDYIKRCYKRFRYSEQEYKRVEKSRCGIIIN
jgi:hypothetical protein